MNHIPTKLNKELNLDPGYKVCMLRAFKGHVCAGRITREHAIIFKGRQLQRGWAIISACARGHEVDQFQDAHTMDKDLNRWVALNRASNDELLEISKVIDYRRERERLNAIYGKYRAPRYTIAAQINYPF